MYTPRSGALRKYKYAIPIYDESGLSDIELCLKTPATEEKVCTQDKPHQFPKAEFTCIPEDEYDNLYSKMPSLSLPSFPVITCEDNPFTESSDSGSDYDLDSEDELWLNEHPEVNLTPSRFEYIFTQLNKRDTHVKHIAVGSLRPVYHEDFSVIFPYWKEKRRNKNNISSWKPKTRRSKEYKGFLEQQDPYVIFTAKVPKTKPKVPPVRKCGSKEETKTLLNKVLLLTEQMKQLKSWAGDMVIKGEHNRNQLVRNFNSLKENSCDHSSSICPSTGATVSSSSDNKNYVNNNQPLRHSTRRTSFDLSYRITSGAYETLPAKARYFSKGLKPVKKSLKFEDVLDGKWTKSKDDAKPIAEKENRQPKRKFDDLR